MRDRSEAMRHLLVCGETAGDDRERWLENRGEGERRVREDLGRHRLRTRDNEKVGLLFPRPGQPNPSDPGGSEVNNNRREQGSHDVAPVDPEREYVRSTRHDAKVKVPQ